MEANAALYWLRVQQRREYLDTIEPDVNHSGRWLARHSQMTDGGIRRAKERDQLPKIESRLMIAEALGTTDDYLTGKTDDPVCPNKIPHLDTLISSVSDMNASEMMAMVDYADVVKSLRNK